MESSWWLLDFVLLNLLRSACDLGLFSMETSAEAPLAQTPLLDSAVAGQDVRFAGAGIMTLLARWARRNIAVIVSTSPFLPCQLSKPVRCQSEASPSASPDAFAGGVSRVSRPATDWLGVPAPKSGLPVFCPSA